MSRATFVETVRTLGQAGVAVANTTTETILAPSIIIPQLAAGVGRQYNIRLKGAFSTTGTPTLTFRARMGSANSNADAAVCVSSAITTASGAANLIWTLDLDVSVRSETFGTTAANVMGIGELVVTDAATNTKVPQMMPASAPAVSAGYDFTAQNFLGVYVTWSAASASNTITTHLYSAQILN